MPLQVYAEVERIAHRLLVEIDRGKNEELCLAIEQIASLARALRSHTASLEYRITQLERAGPAVQS